MAPEKNRVFQVDEVEMMTVVEGAAAPSSDPLTLASAEMAEDEVLIWADTALASAARRRVLPLSVLGWLFLLLLLAWLVKAASTSLWLLIMGLPFIFAVIALALLPWWWPKLTKHTVYAISDRRLFIIRNWPRHRVTSYGPEDIDVVERREHKDGSGDLIFRHEERRQFGHSPNTTGRRRMSERPVGFFGVADVKRLEGAVWALKERRTPRLESATV